MGRYSEIIRLLRARKQCADGVVRTPQKHERQAADAITKLEAEKAELVEAVSQYMAQFGQALDANGIAYGDAQTSADARLRATLAKLDAGQ